MLETEGEEWLLLSQDEMDELADAIEKCPRETFIDEVGEGRNQSCGGYLTAESRQRLVARADETLRDASGSFGRRLLQGNAVEDARRRNRFAQREDT